MKIQFLITFLFACFLNTIAQNKAITENGDTILIYKNGTWENICKQDIKKEYLNSDIKTTVEVDEFSNKKIVKTANWKLFGKDKNNNELTGNIIKEDNVYLINLTYFGYLGCLSEHSSSILIKLTNNEIIECTQVSNTECGKKPTVRFIPVSNEILNSDEWINIMKHNVELLKSYNWVTIRINGSKYYTDIKPNNSGHIENPEQFFRLHLVAVDY